MIGENSGAGDGVFGTSDSGTGVAGISGTGHGVYGRSGGAGNAGYFEGDVTVTANLNCSDVVLSGGDVAEDFDLATDVDAEPGSVMIVDEDGQLTVCDAEYDTRVVGVVAGAGEYRPGVVLDRRVSDDPRATIALIGKVYCKCDAAYGPIRAGDLLTTSPTPAHAMRGSDRGRAFGAVIGEALAPLTDGRGLVPILVSMR